MAEHYDKPEAIREFLEHAPKAIGNSAPDLAGWFTGQGCKVCTVCADRFGQRFGMLPKTWEPIWPLSPLVRKPCDVCGAKGVGR